VSWGRTNTLTFTGNMSPSLPRSTLLLNTFSLGLRIVDRAYLTGMFNATYERERFRCAFRSLPLDRCLADVRPRSYTRFDFGGTEPGDSSVDVD
jgi:hypothetical protein